MESHLIIYLLIFFIKMKAGSYAMEVLKIFFHHMEKGLHSSF